MNKTRFAVASLLLLLGFGLMAPDCDCKTTDPSGPERGSVQMPDAPLQQG